MLKEKAFMLKQHKSRGGRISIRLISSFTVLLIVVWFCGIPSAAGLYEEALEKYRAGKFAEAIDLLTKKLSKDSGDCNLLGWAFFRSGAIDEAIRQFELSLSLNPYSGNSYCGLGYSYFQQGLFNKALENYDKGISQDNKDIDCLLGKGLALEKLQDTENALKVFNRVLSIEKDNHLAMEKVTILSPQIDNKQKEGTEFFARGNYFWVKRNNKKAEPLFIKGVNMSFALPGRFSTEFPEDEKTYLEWFKLIGEMNANLIRVYTILPPQFYHAFRRYNQEKKADEKLFLIHGIWTELPAKSNFKDPEYLNEVKREIKNAVDVVHGDANIPHRYGHAHGVYRSDISEYVLGFIFGREWEPFEVIVYNELSSENSFTGKYLQIANANPMEAWLTEMLDYLIDYESDRYKTQRPVAFMSWPPLDPLYHQTETTFREELGLRKKAGEMIDFKDFDFSKVYDDDDVGLDETKIVINKEYTAGIFASYHVYPYYPDFLRYEEKYSKISFSDGSNYYYNYLVELKNHYKDIPLLISEFGVPTSRGIARFHPEGLHHGGHNESEQADILRKLTLSIRESQCAGGIVFAWIDEWVKSNWMVKGTEERDELWFNAQDPEESYGLIATMPIATEKLRGNPSAWDESTLLYSKDSKLPFKVLNDGFDGARNIKRVYVDYDAGYLYLRIDISGSIDWGKVAYLIGIDTFGTEEGDHKLPFNLGLDNPVGLEYVILLHGEKSKILIDDKYNKIVFDPNLLKLPGLTGYRENKNIRQISNNDGIFTELITTHRRKFSRDGNIFPERIYNASILKQGNRTDDSLSDFYYSKENKFIEIRIPWGLLNFSDPSRLQIIYSKEERRITDGLRIMAASYKPLSINDSTAVESKNKTNITDIFPENLSDIKYYKWQGWEFPKYIMLPKKSYFTMKEVFGRINDPELKIKLPPGFEFTFVIKNHYNSIEEFLKLYKIDDFNAESPYGLALTNLTYGLVKNDPFYILEAKSRFASFYNISTGRKEKELSHLGFQYAENLISGGYKKGFNTNDTLEPIHIEKNKLLIKDFKKIIIGKTAIRLKKNSIIKTQVDRVTRDWLSAYYFKNPPWDFKKEDTVPWHEGKKIVELLDFTDSKIYIVWGTKAKKFGNNWYAPDAGGIYRFMLSEDKVYNYPTNVIIDDQTVIINDTHGINAIAWDSLDTDLVIGCGDHEGKIEAAYYLANNGINVYMPTDRFINMLIGTHTKGVIIGSAPVKRTEGDVVIGDQPIAIDINEPIVVSNTTGIYPLQYYDTPYRYFKELERYTGKPMNILSVNIEKNGNAGIIVDEARNVGAKLIGVRVWTKDEHDAVYSWLKEDKSHRAVLFHSADYPEGYRLFFEFPGQTSFGDINIYFEN